MSESGKKAKSPGSTHASRTIMVDDLTTTLAAVPSTAGLSEYESAIVERNVLGKESLSTRKKSAAYLRQLYSFDPMNPTFRVLRELWSNDIDGRPMLAMLCAQAHDPVLRATSDIVLDTPFGAPFSYTEITEAVHNRFPDAYSEKTARSMGQNIASSWAQSGHLEGRRNKFRTRAHGSPASVAYALFLAYGEGVRGALLFTSDWARVLDTPIDELYELASVASRYGWIDFKKFGDVVEVIPSGLNSGVAET